MHEQHHQHHAHSPDMGHFAAEIDRRYPELYHRVMPYIEEAHMRIRDIGRMDEGQLDRLANEIMRDSGVLHHMPRGHSEETIRDLVKVLLLVSDPGPAAETMSPIVPLALGLGLGSPWFFYPPFFYGPHFHHRRGFHRHGRRGGRGRRR